MPDLRFQFDPNTLAGDLSVTEFGRLETDEGLATAVYLSLFCDRRAEPSDVLPTGPQRWESWPDRRGWWGDSFPRVEGFPLGSRLWLLERSVLTSETVARAQQYVSESLDWLIRLGVADQIDVAVSVPSRGWLQIEITITGPDNLDGVYRYLWDAMREQV